MTKHFDVVSFDNLALKQLEVKRLLTEDEWNEFFMGDDGEMTCYCDLVNKTYSISSTSPLEERFPLTDDILEMFNHLKTVRKNK